MQRGNIIIAYGTVNIDLAMERAKERASFGRPTIVVGIVRNPNTECWWVCVARDWRELTWVSAHRLKREADAQVLTVDRLTRRASVEDDAVFGRLLEELHGNSDECFHETLAHARHISASGGDGLTLTARFQAVRELEMSRREEQRKMLSQRRSNRSTAA